MSCSSPCPPSPSQYTPPPFLRTMGKTSYLLSWLISDAVPQSANRETGYALQGNSWRMCKKIVKKNKEEKGEKNIRAGHCQPWQAWLFQGTGRADQGHCRVVTGRTLVPPVLPQPRDCTAGWRGCICWVHAVKISESPARERQEQTDSTIAPKQGHGTAGRAPGHTLHPSPQWIPIPSQVTWKMKPGPKMRILFSGQKVQDDAPAISCSSPRGIAVLSVQWAFLQQQVLLMLIHGWILRRYIIDLNSKIKPLPKNTVY